MGYKSATYEQMCAGIELNGQLYLGLGLNFPLRVQFLLIPFQFSYFPKFSLKPNKHIDFESRKDDGCNVRVCLCERK